MSNCESLLTTDQLVLQEGEPSRNFYLKRHVRHRLSNGVVIIVTYHYRYHLVPLGFALGKYLNSLSLTPGEEVEISIVRRDRFSRELYEDISIEREFSQELTRVVQDEVTSTFEANFVIKDEISMDVFDLFDISDSAELRLHEDGFARHFEAIIKKTAERVSVRHEIAVDMKTEIENAYCSKRKFKNHNKCQSITYNYFQILKKYRAELFLEGITYDLHQHVYDSLFENKQPVRTLTPTPFTATRPLAISVEAQTLPKQSVGLRVPDLSDIKLPKEYTRDFLKSPKFDKVKVDLEGLLEKSVALNSKPRKTYEYYVNTSGIYVDSMLGKCLACEDYFVEAKELEIAKLKLEVEKMKLEIEIAKKQNAIF